MSMFGMRVGNAVAPLLKWPGGKRALISQLLRYVPVEISTYYEPFVGGGALFFALRPDHAVLSDNNPELINCYIQVKTRPEEVIDCLSKLNNTEQDYYAIRRAVPTDEVKRAARLIYLTTLSFNGIHRENSKGEFNVPYGHKSHLRPCDPKKILAASSALESAELRDADFEAVTQDAQRGDLVYLDPPYTVAHANNGFVKYNSKIFSWQDQIRLARVARHLAERGCNVLVSNADHPSILELYEDFEVHRVTRPSVIAASQIHRGVVSECVFTCSEVS